MRKVYRIGKFRFFNYEDYQRALDDVQKIKYITEEVDVQDPDAVLRLYILIRKKDIKFKSEIGEDYLLYLSDIVADNNRKMLYQTPQYLEETPETKDNRIRNIIGLICLTVAAVSFAFFVRSEYADYKAAKELKELQNLRNSSETDTSEESSAEDSTVDDADENQYTVVAQYIAKALFGKKEEEQESIDLSESEVGAIDSAQSDNEETKTDTQEQQDTTAEVTENAGESETAQIKKEDLTILPEYQDLYNQNNELVGWLKIDGTDIDYPVLQSPTDDSFYLDHDYNKNEDINGTLFISKLSDYVNRDTNITIYGHNMKSGLMFGGLKQYLTDGFWNEHKSLEFDTIYEKGSYEIVAVCLAQVEYQDEEVFKYYDVTDIKSKADFKSYIANIKKLSVFDGDVDMKYGDQILTLSTCNSYTEDGRLFLVAKKVS